MRHNHKLKPSQVESDCYNKMKITTKTAYDCKWMVSKCRVCINDSIAVPGLQMLDKNGVKFQSGPGQHLHGQCSFNHSNNILVGTTNPDIDRRSPNLIADEMQNIIKELEQRGDLDHTPESISPYNSDTCSDSNEMVNAWANVRDLVEGRHYLPSP